MRQMVQVMRMLMMVSVFLVSAYAGSPIRKASFHGVFSGKDYYGSSKDMSLQLSVMSNDGKVVAFYGTDQGGRNDKLFIHNFESTDAPREVTLPADIGHLNTNAGLVSNRDGSRIFFNADDTTGNSAHHLFGMVNGKTGAVTILFRTSTSSFYEPTNMATDAAGDYLYFNQEDGHAGHIGNLYRIPTTGTIAPSLVIQANAITHPSGGVGRHVADFDVSDDGSVIVFFIRGRIENGTTHDGRYHEELFAKNGSTINNLTNNEEVKENLVISGDGSTIVYTGESWHWMVTSPTATLGSQYQIEIGYGGCGETPGITYDGSTILGCSYNSASDAHTYLIQTDGSSRIMVDPYQFWIRPTGSRDPYALSDDGTRTFFAYRWSVYPEGSWYRPTMIAGVFGDNLWSTEVPSVTDVRYDANMYTKMENNEHFDVNVSVYDPQDDMTDDKALQVTNLFPSGRIATSGERPVWVYGSPSIEAISPGVYVTEGARGFLWPSKTPLITARFSVKDDDYNVAYTDTLIQPPATPNLSPIADAGTDKKIAVSQSVVISGTGTDTDGNITAYRWQEGSTVLAHTATFTYTAPASAGSHTLTLSVTDDDNATGSDTVVITVTRPEENNTTTPDDDNGSKTEGAGGGCTYNPHTQGVDMILIFMMLASILYPWIRRWGLWDREV